MQKAKIQVLSAMFIYGTIGVFARHVHMPSSALALCRSGIGALFLIIVLAITRTPLHFSEMKKHIKYLLPAGILLGINWALMFEAYKNVSITVATLCYYLAPVLITLVGSILYKEKLTPIKYISSALAFIGIIFVTGIFEESNSITSYRGILFALIAATMYATIVLCNKHMADISPFDMTISELLLSFVVLLPYVLFTTDIQQYSFDSETILFTLILSIVHTGVAYMLYFPALPKLTAHACSIYSYIDPIVAVICSAWILHEPMSWSQGIGCILILGTTLVSDLLIFKKRKLSS